MRGYVVKKGKSYYAVVYDGVDPGTGKEKRKWVSAGRRRSDAEKLVTDLVKRRNQGVSVATEKLTLGEYLTGRWLPIQESQIRKSTFDSYRRNIELHVLPALAKMPLEKLTASDLDALYASLLVRGRKAATRTGEGLAPKTVRSIHLVVHKALADAERKGLVIRNVAALADPPKVGARKQIEIKAWTAEQLDVFLEAIEAHRLAPAFHLASYTGMRRGEVLGLRWKDLDLDANRLSVRQALVSVAYELHISDVKTGSGRRTIDIEEETVEVLRQWRKARELEAGGPIGEEALVFSKPDTTWIHPDVFSQTFDRVVARIVVPEITLHDLRHTHATLLLQAGVSVKVVCERLGHSNPAFTMSVYQHVLPGMQAEAAVAFAQVLRNAHMVRTAMRTAVTTVNGPSGKVTPLGVDGVLEALGGIEDPSTMAEIAAEAVRMMNRATLAAPSAGTVGWQDVGDTYRLLGELGVLVDRLPQVCDQLARTFQRPAFRSSTRSDSETSETATSLLDVAADEMVRADECGRALGRCIAAAHAAVSHLAPIGDDLDSDDMSTETTVVAESGEGERS
jgi:integrase